MINLRYNYYEDPYDDPYDDLFDNILMIRASVYLDPYQNVTNDNI